MKHQEFYRKYKANYSPIINPIFSKSNGWRFVLMTVIGVLVEPFIMYGRHRSIPFTLHFYLQRIGYLSIIAVPLVVFLFEINRRESEKRRRGYGWVGKFEVISKRSAFVLNYLLLSPGNGHKLKVDRSLFESTRIGDFILIRRDALGNIEEVKKFKNFSRRLTRAEVKRPSRARSKHSDLDGTPSDQR